MASDRPESLGRLRIESLDELLDGYMEYLPAKQFDLADPEIRKQFRDWLGRTLSMNLDQVMWGYKKATDKAIEDCTKLMKDPKHAENIRRQRKEQRQRFAAQEEAHNHKFTGKRVLKGILDGNA